MKNYEELTFAEQKEVAKLFSNWLRRYTKTVINRVMEQKDEIIKNDMAMMLLRELYKREQEEAEDFERSIEFLLRDFESFKEFDPHNHVTEHANSYRDVLYDMYIRN